MNAAASAGCFASAFGYHKHIYSGNTFYRGNRFYLLRICIWISQAISGSRGIWEACQLQLNSLLLTKPCSTNCGIWAACQLQFNSPLLTKPCSTNCGIWEACQLQLNSLLLTKPCSTNYFSIVLQRHLGSGPDIWMRFSSYSERSTNLK